jgi:hypothetical protein
MSGGILPLPLHAFMEWTAVTLRFTESMPKVPFEQSLDTELRVT